MSPSWASFALNFVTVILGLFKKKPKAPPRVVTRDDDNPAS